MSDRRPIIIIGGSAAGPKAAAKARRMDHHAEITLIQKDPDLSMASCGYPYYVGGTFHDRSELLCTPTGVVRDRGFFLNVKDIKALTSTEVTAIDRKNRTVVGRNLQSGESADYEYDKLVIATGSTPIRPPVPGVDLDGISTLQTMNDADYLRKIRDEGHVRNAVVVGGGLIGIETCEALTLAGIDVTIVEMLPQILLFLDWEIAKILENYVKTKVAGVVTENPVAAFLGQDGKLSGTRLKDGRELPCELAVVATGVRPNSTLAREAGLEIGEKGGITVNEHLQTSDPDIYAAGDCIEVTHLITGEKVHAPFGDLANLEGRVVGQNVVVESSARFPGTLQTGVCKVFDYAAGSTGLSETAAREMIGDRVISVITAAPDKPGFMGAELLIIKIVADSESGRILGVQCIGPGDVSKRIGIAAMALQGNMTVDDLLSADLPYAPPFSPAIDNLITCAHVLENKMLGRMTGISAKNTKEKIDNGEDPFLVDTRAPEEYESMRLGVGETLIPLGQLRNRMDELPQDKGREIICFCKISLRGYEAAGLIESRGWTNVKVMEGGIMAWPYGREK